jgi:hypothetical protein
MSGIGVSITGTAVVCCVHDRPKREVVTEAHVAELGRRVGQKYDPKQHKLWLCSCCENLFVDPTDHPRLCHRCQTRPPQHPLGGPLPAPNGEPV